MLGVIMDIGLWVYIKREKTKGGKKSSSVKGT